MVRFSYTQMPTFCYLREKYVVQMDYLRFLHFYLEKKHFKAGLQ